MAVPHRLSQPLDAATEEGGGDKAEKRGARTTPTWITFTDQHYQARRLGRQLGLNLGV